MPSNEKLSHRFHERSLKALAGVHPALSGLYDDLRTEAALRGLYVVVTEGLRSEKRQLELLRSGVSMTLQSRHLTGHAIDHATLPPREGHHRDPTKPDGHRPMP